MNILCAICQDLLEQASDIFLTPCGHVFHFPCLIQWLEKSLTCPECRQKVRRDKITRIYFNFSNTEVIKDDSVTLQQKVDSLAFQVRLTENEFKNSREENITLKKQNSGLREEVKKVESELNQKNSAIFGFKQQILHLKDRLNQLEGCDREKRILQSKLETYENVKSLLCASTDEVEQMLNRTTDISTLVTYVAIMKRELSSSLSKRKDLRSSVKRLQHDLQTMKMERNTLSEDFTKRIEQLEEELAICKSEKDALRKQIAELNTKEKHSDKSEEETPKLVTENSISNSISRKREKDIEFDIDPIMPKKMKQTEKLNLSPIKNDSIIFVSPTVKKTKENEENSPYLPTKSKSILALKERSTQRGGFSGTKSKLISSKKSISALKNSQEKDSMSFDGFGGHSKLEVFPKKSPIKLKRSLSDNSKNKKFKADLERKLDDYVINLT